MPYKGDLGPSSAKAALALALLLLGPLLALLLRRRWRREAERQEEVRRLMILAAEEAEQAELEAAMAYTRAYSEYLPASASAAASASASVSASAPAPAPAPPPAPAMVRTPSPSPTQGQVCALCFSPATARCSQCKAVRYCSGKCQIIHWRQGHKDDCHPANAYDDYVGISAPSPSRRVETETERSGLTDETLDLEGDQRAKVVGIFPESRVAESVSPIVFSEDDMLADKSSVEASGTKNTSGFVAPVPMCFTSSRSKSDAITSAEPPVLRTARLEESSPYADSSSSLRAAVDNSDENPTKPLTHELTSACSMEKSISHSSEKMNVFASKPEAVERSVSDWSDREAYVSGDNTSSEHFKLTDIVQKIEIGKKKSESPVGGRSLDTGAKTSISGFVSSNGALHSKDTETQARQIGKLDSSAMGTINISELLKTKTTSSSVGAQPLNVYSASTRPSRLSNATDSVPMSAKRVVEHSIAPKLSKRYPPELMLFPYDLFIKLYNSEKVELHPCGLTNCGNSCYANSVLQCLAFTRPLTAYLLEGLHSKICPKKEWCFTCEFEGLLMNVKRRKYPLSPLGILSHLENIGSSFGRGREEDAHEFLRYATDAMQLVCLKEAGAKPGGLLAEETTLIQQTFGGYLRSKIKCSRCKGRTERCERMMDLTVEIHGGIDSLEKALSRFTSTEILDGENKYECNRCRSYERAKKKLTILEAPNVLTIALKRFQAGAFGKLNKPVRFPEYLDLAPYMSGTDDKSPIYKLYAVIVHMDVMNASFSGHYICYVKDTQGNWYKANDSQVSKVELGEVLSKDAYMLLYARCSPRAPSSVRKAMAHELLQIKRIRSKGIREKSNPILPQRGPSVALGRSQFYPRGTTDDPDQFNDRHHHTVNDYSSDSSSLFSCSDEGSWSTDSTRDSTTTEELWDLLSGESDRMSLNSPLRFSEESDGFTESPLSSRHCSEAALSGRGPDFSTSGDLSNVSSSGRGVNDAEIERTGGYMNYRDSQGAWFDESPSFLYTDQSKHSRNLVDNFRTVETDWINHSELKSSVLLRRPTRDRTTQTFY